MANTFQTELEATHLLRKHGLYDQGWRFAWDNARRRGGACHYNTKRISMSRYLVPLWSDEEVRQTLLHEIAHALAGFDAAHGPVWLAKAREIGFVRESRTHSNPIVAGRYAAICDTCGGGEVYRAHRFTAAMRQGRHLHRACGSRIRWVDTEGVKV